MNKILKDIIQETLEEVNKLDNPGASFGAGMAMGVFIKHMDKYKESCIEQGFDEAMECAENVIMYANSDFVKKMFAQGDENYDVIELVNKYGLRIVNERYMEYKK